MSSNDWRGVIVCVLVVSAAIVSFSEAPVAAIGLACFAVFMAERLE